MKFATFLLCLCVFTISTIAFAVDTPPPTTASSNTQQFILDNGLTVLVRENPQAPVVSVMTWYRVGSIDEPEGITGISHMLEHMMFKGTKRLKAGEFSDWVSRFGGVENAFTSYDYTGYYQNYAASRLPLALELEAERMQHLEIDPDEFASELKVVKEERRMRVLDSPTALAWEKFSAIARPGTGYAHPVIGWMHDLDKLTPEKVEDWYHRYYAPNNAYLIITGDIDAAETKQLVTRYFGKIPAGEVLSHASNARQAPPGNRHLTLHLPVQVPTYFLAYNLPSLSNISDPHEFYALAMLAGILDGGMSARLESQLVRKLNLASGIGAGYSGMGRGGGLFTLSATPNPGISLEQLQSAIDDQIEQLKTTPPSEDELRRQRAQVLADDVYSKDSNFSQARELGHLLAVGLPWQTIDSFAEALAKVTPDDVSAVANKYFTNNRRASAFVLPEAAANQEDTP